MDLSDTLALAGSNLTSPPVLAFVLGVLAAALRADLRLPDAVYQATSMYLHCGRPASPRCGHRCSRPSCSAC